MKPQYLFQDAIHVHVGRVHLVDHEQMSKQSSRPKVSVPDAKRREKHLVNGAHDDRACEEALRLLRGPSPMPASVTVGPQHLETRKAMAHFLVVLEVPGDGQDYWRSAFGFERSFCRIDYTSMDLCRCGPRGQGEGQAVHEPSVEQVQKPDDRRFRLA
jgi:hypothetical protein